MILRMSSLFVRTLRDDPADAEVPSHRLLVRAGYIRRAAPGIYTWLPLGLRVLRKIENIIREEMDAIGAQELLFPALLPREPYEASGRWTEYGAGIFRLKDRKDDDYLLGPTHEEMFTLVVKDLYSSYKDLPLSIYQIQTKYRDEARPRAGLLRGREFVMKDSYSFDIDDAGLDASYQKHRDAYIRIFDKLGFEYVIVKAEAGAMGGSKSEEFLAKAAVGEDTYVRCTRCDYAANVEAVDTPAPGAHVVRRGAGRARRADARTRPRSTRWSPTSTRSSPATTGPGRPPTPSRTSSSRYATPTAPSRRWRSGCPATARSTPSGWSPSSARAWSSSRSARRTSPPGRRWPRATSVPARWVRRSPPASATSSTPASWTGTRWVTGADVDGSHVLDLVAGRDFSGDGVIDVAEVRDGDPCPVCGATDGGILESARGIEMGHIFQLGRKYADALDLQVLDENGKLVTVTMGSYGIGPSRAVAAIAEGTLDELGLCWPRDVAPADVHLVATGKDEEVFAAAERIATELSAAGVEVLYDDRPGKVSPGVKFKDAEMIGVPTIVVVGRNLADGTVEVRDRASGERENVAVESVVNHVVGVVRA